MATHQYKNKPRHFFRNVTLLFFISSTILFSALSPSVWADEEGGKLKDLEGKIREYESKIKETQTQQKTLASTIESINNEIYLTEVKVAKIEADVSELQDQIKKLTKKIVALDDTLDETSIILYQRIVETYKRSLMPNAFLLVASNNFSEFFSRMKYLQVVQKNDKEVMYEMEEAKLNFDIQKADKEEKQKELEKLEKELDAQQSVLSQQRSSKQQLLTVTKNDEKKFQELLGQVRAEFEAIQAIISNKGDESEIGPIKAGDQIASVIQGASCNSQGAHLHFTVGNGSGGTHNPFSYLRSIDHQNCSGGGECSPGDDFNPSGSWPWPIEGPVKYNQGYGSTWAVRNTWVSQIYSFHNGIDINGSSSTVRAVADGILYRGSYTGYRGCRLRYVRVDHNDSEIETFYLHVNY